MKIIKNQIISKKNLINCILITFSILITSCGLDGLDQNYDDIKFDEERVYNASFRIDGTHNGMYEAYAEYNTGIDDKTNRQLLSLLIQDDQNDDGSQTVDIVIAFYSPQAVLPNLEEKTYAITNLEFPEEAEVTASLRYWFSPSNDAALRFEDFTKDVAGALTITELSDSKLSGTYQFKISGLEDDSKTIEVKEGIFYIDL